MGRVGEWLRKSLLYHPIALCQLPNSLTPTLSPTGGDGKVVDFYRAMCPPLEGGSGRGLTKLIEVVQHIWRCEKVEESWLVGKLRLLPKSGAWDLRVSLSNPNNWRGITLLAVIANLFCSVLSNRMTSQ
jgi:hypothetical protein